MKISVIYDPTNADDKQRALDFMLGNPTSTTRAADAPAPAAKAIPGTSAPAPAATAIPGTSAPAMDTSLKFPPMTGTPDMTNLDVHGRPWDGRIHAKTKTQNKDGSWKYGKGVQKDTPDLIVHVNAQLDALGGTPAPAAMAPVPGTPAPAPTSAPQAPAPVAPTAPVAPAPQALEPAFQEIVNKQNRILEGGIAVVPGSYEHYKIPADYGPAAAIPELYAKWECHTIDEIYAKGAECWAALMPCMNFIWAE